MSESTPSKESLIGEVVELISRASLSSYLATEPAKSRVRDILSSYEMPTLNMVKAAADTKTGKYLYATLIAGSKMTEQEVQDYCIFATEDNFAANGLREGNVNEYTAFSYIRGLRYYPKLEPLTSGTYPERRLQQINALFRVTMHLLLWGRRAILSDPEDKESTIHFIEDYNLSELVITSSSPDRIADIVEQRNLFDPEDIENALSIEEQLPEALRNGGL